MNNVQGVGAGSAELRRSGNGARDLGPAYVNNPGLPPSRGVANYSTAAA